MSVVPPHYQLLSISAINNFPVQVGKLFTFTLFSSCLRVNRIR